jgi:hypothetical protein
MGVETGYGDSRSVLAGCTQCRIEQPDSLNDCILGDKITHLAMGNMGSRSRGPEIAEGIQQAEPASVTKLVKEEAALVFVFKTCKVHCFFIERSETDTFDEPPATKVQG